MSRKNMIAQVNVEYAGGVTVTSRKLLHPLMKMFAAYAGKVKYRISKQQKLANGRKAGRYAPVKYSEKKIRREIGFWTRKGDAQKIAQWSSMLRGLKSRQETRNRSYKRRGGLWKGLAVKAQKTGKKITMGFYGSTPGAPGQKKISNRTKAWFSMMPKGRHREGIHLFTPTEKEFETLKAAYAINVVPGLLRDIKDRQEFEKVLKKFTKADPRLKAQLSRFMNM